MNSAQWGHDIHKKFKSFLHLETKNNYCVQKIQIQSSEIHNISFEDFVAKIAMDQTLISPFLYSYK